MGLTKAKYPSICYISSPLLHACVMYVIWALILSQDHTQATLICTTTQLGIANQLTSPGYFQWHVVGAAGNTGLACMLVIVRV